MNAVTNQSPQITINTTPNSVDSDDDVTNETHYITVDAGFTSTPLPVELAHFSARQNDCKVILTWITDSEINNDYFELQRSTDGRSFETIEEIKGSGSTFANQTYTYTDQPKSVNNYYRLKQIDFDRNFTFSNVINASIEDLSLIHI